MTRGVSIEVNTSELFGLVAKLSNGADALKASARSAVVEVATRVRDRLPKIVTSQVNLPESYVDGNIRVENAGVEKGTAITAQIVGRSRSSTLTRYGAAQLMKANVWTAATYAAKFGSLEALRRPTRKAPLMPWKARTGDGRIGIPAGQKRAGIAVGVRAGGGRKPITYAFFMPLRSGRTDGGNGLGVFTRDQNGRKLKHRYGPSVSQVLLNRSGGGVYADIEPQVAEELQKQILSTVEIEVRKVLNV